MQQPPPPPGGQSPMTAGGPGLAPPPMASSGGLAPPHMGPGGGLAPPPMGPGGGLAPPPMAAGGPGLAPPPMARPPGSGRASPAPPPNAGALRPYVPPGPPPPGAAPGAAPYPHGPPYPTGPPPMGPPPGAHLSLPPASSVYPTPQPNTFRPHAPNKRIIVCCDGTWLDADSNLRNGEVQLESNVTRIARAVKPEASDGVQQIVLYQGGVGTDGGAISRAAGGATAGGLSANIREAYSFVCLNHSPGDEIFLIGFSRGAFTARSVGGLISTIGLLTKSGLHNLGVIFKDVQHRHDPKYVSSHPDTPIPKKTSVSDPKYLRELVRMGQTRIDIAIKAIAVWDTVGSLGIPRVPVLEAIGLQRRAVKEYAFYDTVLGNNVENAFQALALDEHRAPYSPTLWEKPRRRDPATQHAHGGLYFDTALRQVWFPGVHSNIGGGYRDPGIANITFAWMIAQLETFLDFSGPYLAEQAAMAEKYYDHEAPSPQTNRRWSFGFIYNSMSGLYSFAGRANRTPGEYTRTDPLTGRPTRKALRETCEYVHASVRARMTLEGPGPMDKGNYEPPALAGYKLRLTGMAPNAGSPAVWESVEKASSKKGGGPRRTLLEAPLFPTELRLLADSPEIQEGLATGRKPSRRSSRRDSRRDSRRSDDPRLSRDGSGRRSRRDDEAAAAAAAGVGAGAGAASSGSGGGFFSNLLGGSGARGTSPQRSNSNRRLRRRAGSGPTAPPPRGPGAVAAPAPPPGPTAAGAGMPRDMPRDMHNMMPMSPVTPPAVQEQQRRAAAMGHGGGQGRPRARGAPPSSDEEEESSEEEETESEEESEVESSPERKPKRGGAGRRK